MGGKNQLLEPSLGAILVLHCQETRIGNRAGTLIWNAWVLTEVLTVRPDAPLLQFHFQFGIVIGIGGQSACSKCHSLTGNGSSYL